MTQIAIRCMVCDAVLDEEELFCPNCGAESPHKSNDAPRATHLSTHNFECRGCGAAMSYDASAGSLRCPFCGSVELESKPDSPMLAPESVVPFSIARDRAMEILRRWLNEGFFTPGDLSRQAEVVGMTAVYVPYWIFSGNARTNWTADSSTFTRPARGDWFPLTGEHSGRHDGIVVGASGALTPAETLALCPFDLSAGTKPDQVDLENVIFEQFTVPRKYARPLAIDAIKAAERDICRENYVPGRSRNVQANVLVTSLSSVGVLLPVWIMAYRYQHQLFRFLINGKSGRTTGTKPVSMTKIVLTACAIGAGVLLLVGMLALL